MPRNKRVTYPRSWLIRESKRLRITLRKIAAKAMDGKIRKSQALTDGESSIKVHYSRIIRQFDEWRLSKKMRSRIRGNESELQEALTEYLEVWRVIVADMPSPP